MALAMCLIASPTPRAFAASRVSCGELDQIHQSLDDDITAGIDGLRQVINYPYVIATFGNTYGPNQQKLDADNKLAMVDHGIQNMQDINSADPVPELALLLDNLRQSAADMNKSVNSLFSTWSGWEGDSYDRNVPVFTWPNSSNWATIDNADQKKNDIYDLVNSIHVNCAP